MLGFLFDTDHLTLFESGHPFVSNRVATHPPGTIGISVITVAEALRGRLASISRAKDGKTRILRYGWLVRTVQLLTQFPIVEYDQRAENSYQQIIAMRLRVGSQDSKIAAIALANNLTVISRNKRDFGKIPNLMLEDWSY